MMKVWLCGIGMPLFLLVAVNGCGGGKGEAPKGPEKPALKISQEESHEHGDGPHKGTIAHWGGGKYHVEFCMDHGKKQATVYILGSDGQKAAPIKTPKLLLTIKEPSFQIELKATPQEGDPKGTASRFVGTHDNFAKEQEFAGTISGEVDGVPYADDFKEEPAGGKKDKK